MRVTIIEDNIGLANGIGLFLRDQGHAVNTLHDGQEGLAFLLQEETDIVVLDLNLPSLAGMDILKSLRQAQNMTPVILLTARGDLKDRVAGLDAGADDYLIKPFEMEELDARIRALIRRKPAIDSQRMAFGDLVFDRTARRLSVKGTPINLPRRELAAFECLFERQNMMVTKAQLTDHIYGVGADMDEKVVEIYVSRLRKKLLNYGVSIKAARGLGYMMDLPE